MEVMVSPDPPLRLTNKVSPCAFQERPCTRCIKRNIGHLCHDELRDPIKRSKSEHDTSTGEEETSPKHETSSGNGMSTSFQPGTEQQIVQDADLSLDPPPLPQGGPVDPAQILTPSPVSGTQTQTLNSSNQQCKHLSKLLFELIPNNP